MPPNSKKNPKRKAKIPKAIREQVWRNHAGELFEGKCFVTWCTNRITVFDFEVGHNIPESKGGSLDLTNLRPLCGRCNCSMGNMYTIDEWNKIGHASQKIVKVLVVSSEPPTTSTGCCLFPWLRR